MSTTKKTTPKKTTAPKKTATKGGSGATRGRQTKKGATAPKAAKKATAAKPAPATAKPAAEARKPSLLSAAVEILKRVDEPLGAKDLATRVIDEGLWATKGKTPEATLYSAMIREIAQKGEQARFRKVGRGRFALSDRAWEG